MRYLVRCTACEGSSDLDTDAPGFAGFPVIAICPHCEESFTIKRSKGLSRVPPTEKSVECTVITDEIIREEEESEAGRSKEQDKILPFWRQANMIADHVRQVTTLTNDLRRELDNFTMYVTKFFASQWRYATHFAKRYRPGYMQEFLTFPFLVLPVKCEDELAAQYSRWVVTPLFFESGFGYRIQPGGGFRLELVNQYSRLQFPLESNFAVKLEVPPDLMLEVHGDKITGRSLAYCWQDIPGIIEEADHTSNNPSIRIKNSLEARTWLARHAVIPWTPNPIPHTLLHVTDFESDLKFKRHFAEAFEIFLSKGRIGVYWSDMFEARRFAALAGIYMRGITAVFTGRRNDDIAWGSIYQNSRRSWSSGNEFVYFTTADQPNFGPLMKCSLIILDTYSDFDTEIIDRLFDYRGRVIVIGPDPTMDFDTTNVLAAKLHALTGWQYLEFKQDEEWPEKPLANGLEDIKASLLQLCSGKISIKNPL